MAGVGGVGKGGAVSTRVRVKRRFWSLHTFVATPKVKFGERRSQLNLRN